MAITITDQPTNFAKVGQKLMVVATSTEVAQPNFRYVVRVGNLITSETTEILVPPNPSNVLMFDLKDILKASLTQNGYLENSTGINFITNGASSQWCTNDGSVNSFTYDVNVLEGYDIGGVFTIDEESSVNIIGNGNQFIVINAHYKLANGYKPDPNLTYSLTSTTSLMMGSRNSTTHLHNGTVGINNSSQRVFIPVRRSELDWGRLSFMVMSSTSTIINTTEPMTVRLTIIDSAGSPNVVENYAVNNTGGQNLEICYIDAYPANIIAYGNYLAPYPNWRYYEIAVYNSSAQRKSAIYTFYPIDDDCTFNNVRLAWWDDVVGGFDYFNFQRKNEITVEVERKRIKPVVGTYNATSFSFNTFDAEIKEGMIDAVDYLEVTSGWIQEGEFELLQHLVKSEAVYIVGDDGTLTPVVMETNSFLVNKERNAKLKSVAFRLRIAQQNIQ
jgi:hypothetical protein